VLTDARQRRAWLPAFLRCQLPRLPEHRLTTADGFEVERMLRRRVGAQWAGTSEFVDTARRMRTAIRIPGAAHCALEYQRWAFRSQWRPDGRRFMATMRDPIDIPVLSLRGEHDNYLLRPTFHRGHRWAPHRRLVTVPEAGHFAHQENPDVVTTELAKFLA